MTSDAKSVEEYLSSLAGDRQEGVRRLRNVIRDNLPPGFEETMSYGMIGFVVPHRLYPAGYHVDPKLPLPFINIASQKQYISLYHSGIYSDAKLLEWFTTEYAKQCETKLNMGKSCIRFRKISQIPYELIGELATRMSPKEWIKLYEARK